MPDYETSNNYCLPEVTFSAFIMSLASSALVCLGEVPDPSTGAIQVNLVRARHNIDILEMLRQKTSSNINSDESDLLNSLLYELRLKFVIINERK